MRRRARKRARRQFIRPKSGRRLSRTEGTIAAYACHEWSTGASEVITRNAHAAQRADRLIYSMPRAHLLCGTGVIGRAALMSCRYLMKSLSSRAHGMNTLTSSTRCRPDKHRSAYRRSNYYRSLFCLSKMRRRIFRINRNSSRLLHRVQPMKSRASGNAISRRVNNGRRRMIRDHGQYRQGSKYGHRPAGSKLRVWSRPSTIRFGRVDHG